MEVMKINNIIMLLSFIAIISLVSCEKDDPKVEYSPVWPISGEWYVHIANEDGTPAYDTYLTLSTYNTSENVNNMVWMKLANATVPFGVLGKVNCDVSAKTLNIDNGDNTLYSPAKKFSVLEGKIMEDATTTKSNTVTDSIYIRYSTEVDGNTYVLSGHRRTNWPDDQY